MKNNKKGTGYINWFLSSLPVLIFFIGPKHNHPLSLLRGQFQHKIYRYVASLQGCRDEYLHIIYFLSYQLLSVLCFGCYPIGTKDQGVGGTATLLVRISSSLSYIHAKSVVLQANCSVTTREHGMKKYTRFVMCLILGLALFVSCDEMGT